MISEKMVLEVITPEGVALKEEVREILVEASDGWIGILPGHAPLIAKLKGGVLEYEGDDGRRYMTIGEGVLKVSPEKVVVLTKRSET
jgi:F-type H+-transporting ATPase subunit epsilon